MMLNNKEDKTMPKTENLKAYRTLRLPLLLLMSLFMVLGIAGALIVNYFF
jgi:hypothetical protein